MASRGIRDTNTRKLAYAQQMEPVRMALLEQLSRLDITLEERIKLTAKLKRNRNASFTRYRRRSSIDGRPRANVLVILTE